MHPSRKGITMNIETAKVLEAWLATEREVYARKKFAEETKREDAKRDMRRNPHLQGTWGTFISNYWQRVDLFGLDTPQGRQAMGKLIVTLMHCLETAIDIYGPMPKAGVPSGEIS